VVTSKELIEAGIKPGELFGILLRECKDIEEAKLRWEKERPVKVEKKQIKQEQKGELTVLDWLCENDCLKGLLSREFKDCRVASKSERRRWLESKAVIINGQPMGPDDVMKWPVTSLIFFPSSNNKVTML